MIFHYKKKKIMLDAEKCNLFGMFRGLMFRSCEKSPALLLFDFKKPRRLKIHSCFVFFPFVAVWLDGKNEVIEARKIKPWNFCVFPKKRFCRLIEIPCNEKYERALEKLEVPRR